MVFSGRKKEIAKVRFTFFLYEIALVFIFLFILLLIPVFSIPLVAKKGSILYGILFFVIRAIIIFLGIPLILYLTNLLFDSQKKIILDEDLSPSIGHLKLFKVTKKNFKYQILYGFLLFFLVFLPMDFFGYLFIPDMLEYQAWAFFIKDINSYLLSSNYFIFLISVIIIQISVALTEETVTRGFLAKRGNEYFFKMSAVMISSLYFGLGHFAYFLDLRTVEALSRKSFPFWFPIVWFIQAFIIGIILALLVLRKKWLLPAIIAHALNNIVSAHTIWSYWQQYPYFNFQPLALFVYYPLLIIGVMLIVWYFSRIKEGFSIGFPVFKTYFKRDSKESTKGDLYFRIFFDILIGILIFLFGFLLAV